MNMIEIQDAYIARISTAHANVGKRSAGLRLARSKRAARKDAMRQLTRRGFTDAQATKVIQDAHDMFILNSISR